MKSRSWVLKRQKTPVEYQDISPLLVEEAVLEGIYQLIVESKDQIEMTAKREMGIQGELTSFSADINIRITMSKTRAKKKEK